MQAEPSVTDEVIFLPPGGVCIPGGFEVDMPAIVGYFEKDV